MRWPERIEIVEVGPRDGLQNEPNSIATADKVRLVQELQQAGLRRIEVTSMVHPKWVPQLADAAEVWQQVEPRPGGQHLILVPNLKGLERALAVGAQAVGVVVAASSTFNQKNINMTTAAAMEHMASLIPQAKAAGCFVRAYISTAFGCPYEGDVPVAAVLDLAQRFLALGADELSVADTIGIAHPRQVEDLFWRVLEVAPLARINAHFHDTRGLALANVVAAMQVGIASFDAAVGGLGGCPFAPGAAGNLATEDLVYLAEQMGIATGVQLQPLLDTATWITAQSARRPAGHIRPVLRPNTSCDWTGGPR